MTAPKPVRADGFWADDLSIGQTFTSGTYRMEESEMLDFAEHYDPQPYHLDEDAAVGTFFNGLVASGWHTSAVSMRLSVEAFAVATGIVGAGGEFTWPSATVAGDELHVEMTIKDFRWSNSRPDQAILSVGSRTLNQDGQVRQSGTMNLLAWRRPGGENSMPVNG
jgi:acyl dehydratase